MVKISVYSTPTCPFCRTTKEFLKEKGVEFLDIDVSCKEYPALHFYTLISRWGLLKYFLTPSGSHIHATCPSLSRAIFPDFSK